MTELYKSYDELVANIERHNRDIEGPVTFILDDSPMDMTFGWRCKETGVNWKMKLIDLRKDNRWYKNFSTIQERYIMASKFSELGKNIIIKKYGATCFKCKQNFPHAEVSAEMDFDPDLYESFDELCENVKQHNIAINGPVTIISADDLMRLTLGWACVETEKVWKIKIGTLREWLESQKLVADSECDLIRSNRMAFASRAGKLKLAEELSELGKIK